MRSAFLFAAILAVAFRIASAPAAEAWAMYNFPERGFSIAFPAAPKVTKSTPRGAIPVTQFQYNLDGVNFAHDVSVIEYPPGRGVRGDATGFLNFLVDKYAKGSGAAVRSRGPVTLAGRPGVEAVLVDAAHGTDHLIDLTVGKDRVYLVVSVGVAGTSASTDAKFFRDSLRLSAE